MAQGGPQWPREAHRDPGGPQGPGGAIRAQVSPQEPKGAHEGPGGARSACKSTPSWMQIHLNHKQLMRYSEGLMHAYFLLGLAPTVGLAGQACPRQAWPGQA